MRIRRLAVTSALLTAAVAGACGASPEGPGRQVSFQDALEATLNGDAVEIQVRFAGAQDDVAAFMDDGYTDDEENARYTAILLDSLLALTFGQDGTFGADVRIGGLDHAVELRGAGKTMAARAEIVRIAEMYGVSRAEVSEGLAFLKQMGQGDLAAALMDGTWISADLGPMESFMRGMGGGMPGMPSFSEMQKKSQQLTSALPGLFSEVVTAELVGTEDSGHHYHLTMNTKKAFEAFWPLIADFYGDFIPEAELAEMRSEVPDETVVADAWVSGGRLSRLDLDLTQFKDAPGPVALRFDLPAEPAGVTMPDSTTEVDLVELMGTFFGGMPGLDS